MLTPDNFHKFIEEQKDLGHSITDTLRAFGLDILTDEARGESQEFTKDEQALSDMANAAALSAAMVALASDSEASPPGFALQGLMIGLALGYAAGIADAPTPDDDSPLTFPEDWNEEGSPDA